MSEQTNRRVSGKLTAHSFLMDYYIYKDNSRRSLFGTISKWVGEKEEERS